MYDVFIALFITAFFALVAARMWLNYRRRVRRSMVPQTIAKRLAKQTARKERWAREKAEELARVARAKYVKQTLDVLPLLVAAHYAPMRRAVRPN